MVPGLVGMITGMVAGLATVTPASGFIRRIGAIILGISSGIICYIAVGFIKNKLNLDDSLDVFAVHGVGAWWYNVSRRSCNRTIWRLGS